MGQDREVEETVNPKKIKKPTKDNDDKWKHKLRKDILQNDLKVGNGNFVNIKTNKSSKI